MQSVPITIKVMSLNPAQHGKGDAVVIILFPNQLMEEYGLCKCPVFPPKTKSA
jgi:hypothetical protein